MKFDKDRFSDAVRNSNMRITDIAKAAKISRTMVYLWGNGTHPPSAENLASIAQVLGLPMEHFFCNDCSVSETPGEPHVRA